MSAALRQPDAEVNDGTLYEAQAVANGEAGAVERTRVTTQLHPAMAARKWQPGQSGNPGGQGSRVTAMRKLAATHTVEAMESLIEMLSRLAATELCSDARKPVTTTSPRSSVL